MIQSVSLLMLAALASVLSAAAPARAQGSISQRLASATSLKCVFAVRATGEWTKGEATATVKTEPFTVAFTAIESQEGTAEAVGDFGPSFITVRLLGNHLHLMQMMNAGPIYVTTVFSRETRAGKLQAVHSRHEYTAVSLPGFTSRPEQYYGECETGQ